MRAVHQLGGLQGKQLLNMFPQCYKSAVYQHAKKPLNGDMLYDRRKRNQGRTVKISAQEKRKIRRTLATLRKHEVTFTSKRIQEESGVNLVSNRSIRRCLNQLGYRYLRSRKKGLLHQSDLRKRLQFCRNIRRSKLRKQFWRDGISFYLDGKRVRI